ncbi:MAG: hypothetical protein NT067_03985 [Candidatus Diapherotrites archaeon]|nr:hypothetical protein [Candidatus Diapherotrites archaeon]
MRTFVLIGFLLLFAGVLFAGCNQPPAGGSQATPTPAATPAPATEQDLKLAYDSLSQKFGNSGPMKLSYAFTMDFGEQSALGLSKVDMDMGLYMLSEQKSKTVVSMAVLGQNITSAVYNLDGKSVTCTESAMLAQPVQCELGKEAASSGTPGVEVKKLDEMFTDFKITALPAKSPAGRPAQCFLLEFKGKDLKDKSQFGSSFEEGGSIENYSFTEEICLDSEKGFASSMDLKTKVYSELSKEETNGMGFSMELESFSAAVSETDLALPMPFGVMSENEGAECSKDTIKMKIVPFAEISGKQAVLQIGIPQYSGTTATMQVQQEKTITLPAMEQFKESELSISPDSQLSGSVMLSLCIEKDCISSTCTVAGESAAGTEPAVSPESICPLLTVKDQCEIDITGDEVKDCTWDATAAACKAAGE